MAYRYLLILFLLSGLPSTQAKQRFQASIEESRWELQSSPVRCELKHAIPRYGEGVFIQSAGGELAFQMHVLDPPVASATASMLSVPAFWKPGEQKELAQITLDSGRTPFYFTRDLALRMLYELDASRFPTLQYQDFADQTEQVSVALSSVNFHTVLPRFRQCIRALKPYGVEGLKDAMVMFDFGRAELNYNARQQLDGLALFATHEASLRFFIEGHTDSRGTRRFNQRLAAKRTSAVRDYLVARGVEPSRITIKAYGERQPLVSNHSDQGRAKNRRVTVSVINER